MKVLVTGVTGSLGSIVSRKLMDEWDCQVVGFSRDEFKQALLPKHKNLTLYLGDVRDRDRIIEASRGVEIIFHFAALKHVDKLEENPEEAIQTNVQGTENVLHAQRINGIKRVVLSSTDKAAYPVNAYGMTKGLAERLVLRNKSNVVCRYGNVLASRGSVIEKFVKTLKEGYVEITDARMTRFWITLDDASDFVIDESMPIHGIFHTGWVGGLFTPNMRAANIELIADAVAACLEITEFEKRYVGVRPGEKTAECLRTEFEGEECHSDTVHSFTFGELVEMIRPMVG